jgi:hypothetical protein
MNAEILMLISGITAFAIIVYQVRQRELREKYAIVWLGCSVVLLLVGIFPGVLKSFAEWAHLSFAAATMFFIFGALFIYSFAVSVSLSRSHRRQMRLTQEIALIDQRLRTMENSQGQQRD